MNSTLKKAILFGVGAFHLTKEKVETFVKELESEGALDADEGKKLFDEVMQESGKRTQEFGKMVEAEVKRVLNEMGYEKKADTSTQTAPEEQNN